MSKTLIFLAFLAISNCAFLSFDFVPKTPQSIPNPLGMDINLKCTLKSSDASDTFFGIMKSGSGSVNGIPVPASGISFTIKNSDVVTISGNAGSEVSITNNGANTVHADCDLATVVLGSPAPNSFLSFDFAPKTPQSIPNPLGIDINLKCTIKSSDATDSFFGVMKSGTGSVNGIPVPAAGITFVVKNGDVVTISGNSGSEVSITNNGANSVHADCDLATVVLGTPAPNSFLSFDFAPKTPQSIPNPLGIDINLKCTIKSSDATDSFFGVMKSGTGSVNGIPVPAAGITFVVKNGDVVTISGNSGSEVSITNNGANSVHADCDLAQNIKTKKSLTETEFLHKFGSMLNNLKDLGSLDFAPNVPQSISNPLFWEISASCKITTIDASDILSGKMTAGTGTFNGQTLPAEGLQLPVKTGDSLNITASSEASVTITNLGKNTLHADCGLTTFEILEKMLKKFNKSNRKHKKHHGKFWDVYFKVKKID